jgi:hypothetical protein
MIFRRNGGFAEPDVLTVNNRSKAEPASDTRRNSAWGARASSAHPGRRIIDAVISSLE